MESCPSQEETKASKSKRDSQPGNLATAATSESANLPDMDEEQASPGISGMWPSEPPSTAGTRTRNVRKHNTTNWSGEEKKTIYLCFQIVRNEQLG